MKNTKKVTFCPICVLFWTLLDTLFGEVPTALPEGPRIPSPPSAKTPKYPQILRSEIYVLKCSIKNHDFGPVLNTF